jgi:outer membrane protein OmpA-like peptidoglycan-associated protein
MRRQFLLAAFFCLLCVSAQVAVAQAPRGDVKGARDHALVGRYEGSTIAFSKLRDYDEMRFPKVRLRNSRILTDDNSVAAKGRSLRQRYRGPVDRSSLEVVRNFEQKLKAQGFETLFFCRTQECGGSDLWFAVTDQVRMHGLPPKWENQTYLLAELKRPQGSVYVSLLSVEQGSEVNTLVDVVETRAMETDKIKVLDAAALKGAIDRDGKATLYGIQFEFDKAEIKPESQGQIGEIAAYLKANASVAVVVTGHTDSKGGFDYNVDLSRRRAQAVVAALGRLGIAQNRLTAFGAGMAAPVASNDGEAGQALNRRVEIVKR